MSTRIRTRYLLKSIVNVLLVAALTYLSPGMAAATSIDAVAPAVPQPKVRFVGLVPEQAQVVSEVLGLFDDAGLNLPSLVIRGSDDKALCHDRDGWYGANSQAVHISICSSQRNSRERHVLLHELAHAWTAFDLLPQRRAVFQALRGFTYWLDYDHAAWSDNGGEQAAEIIAWGLNDHAAPTLAIDHRSCAELRAGYVALTGSNPIHGLTKICSGTRAPHSGPT